MRSHRIFNSYICNTGMIRHTSTILISRLLLLTVFLCVITACTPISSTDTTSTSDNPTEEPFYAWDFTMQSLAGETYTLSELRGQWVVVNFWATWCAPCREEMPELQAISENYADNLVMLGINNRESAERIQAYADELGIRFPLLLDPDDSVLLNYQVINLPQTLIVDPNGELVWRRFGPINLEEFDTIIAELTIAHQE